MGAEVPELAEKPRLSEWLIRVWNSFAVLDGSREWRTEERRDGRYRVPARLRPADVVAALEAFGFSGRELEEALRHIVAMDEVRVRESR